MTTRRAFCRCAALGGLGTLGAALGACTGGGAEGDPGSPATSRRGVPGAAGFAASGLTVTSSLGVVELYAQAADLDAWQLRVRRAAAVVAAVWGPSSRPLRVTVCADDAEFAAVAEGLDPETAGATTARGVFIAPAAQRTLTEGGRLTVLAHELTHARLGHLGSGRGGGDGMPAWLREGAAEWTAMRVVTVEPSARWPALAQRMSSGSGTPLTGPPPDSVFLSDATLAYEWSAAYVTYLAEVAGERATTTLIRSNPGAQRVRRRTGELTAHRFAFAAWAAARLG